MPAHPNEALVREAYEAYNSRDFDHSAALYAPDVEIVSAATRDEYRGRTGYQQQARAWAAALPDSRLEIAALRADDASATVEYTLRGTHTGPLILTHGHVPPTWMQVEVRFCDVLELREGAIARVRSYHDAATLLRQMGLLPNSPIHPADRRAALELYALETDAPPQQRNKASVQWFLQSVINQHNPQAAADFCVPNLSWHGGPLGELRDLGAFQQLLSTLFLSFPDLQAEVQDILAEGDRVAARLVLRGTHRGDFRGIPPTGKVITANVTSTYRVLDGRIIEEWWQHDLFSVMQQLDAMPAIVRNGD